MKIFIRDNEEKNGVVPKRTMICGVCNTNVDTIIRVKYPKSALSWDDELGGWCHKCKEWVWEITKE
jgi:hypothetical protein